MATKKPAGSKLGGNRAAYPDNHITLGIPWQPNPALKMPDPNIPMPVLDDAAGEREVRRATGYGYSDYV